MCDDDLIGNCRETEYDTHWDIIHGTHWEVSKDQGVLSLVEYGKQFNGEKPGNIKLGAYNYNSWDASLGDTRKRNGVYISSELVMPSAGSKRELGLFFRGGMSTSNYTEYYSMVIDGVLNYSNIFSWLKDDVFGIGFIYGKMDNDILHDIAEETHVDYEMVIEATIQFTLFHRIVLQPDIQYFLHPRGTSSIENAMVIGIRLYTSF